MAAGTEQDTIKFSEKKIEGADENMKTVDCLRGRLLAERQASKASKEESELIGKKLIELENRLREETKLSNKAEKKLQFFMKKLQSLKIDHALENSETSNSLESFTFSYKSSHSHSSCSSTSNLKTQNPDQDCTDTSISNSNSNSNSSICEPDPNNDANTKELSSDSNNSSSSCEEDSKIVGNSLSPSLKNSSRNESDNEEDRVVDNSLALVPVNWVLPSSDRSGPEIVDKNVGEALNALRLARKRIQFCIERRHMIRVGPSS